MNLNDLNALKELALEQESFEVRDALEKLIREVERCHRENFYLRADISRLRMLGDNI